jgi:enolase
MTACGDRIQIGEDLYVTNPRFTSRGINARATNAVQIKLNQIGTVNETIKAVQMCRDAAWGSVISHRSGETEGHVHFRLCGCHGQWTDQGWITVPQ